jgi:hypothetical protein
MTASLDLQDFAPGEGPQVEIRQIGHEAQPVAVIDGLLRDPAALVDYACTQARFAPLREAGNFYPGLRAPAPRTYVQTLITALRPILAEVFDVPPDARARVTCALSLATLPPERLTVAQRLPHIDTHEPRQLAILQYLCDPAHGGTAFYRHRQTGFETVGLDRSELYLTTLRGELDRDGPPAAAYVAASTELFEQTARIEPAFGRVVVYRSNLLHSGVIDPRSGLSPDPRQGRLTANTFFVFE